MALTDCRECGEQVSTEAESCPHCGAPSPALSAQEASQKQGEKGSEEGTGTGMKLLVGCLSFLGAIMLLGMCVSLLDVDSTDTTTTGTGSLDNLDTGPTAADVEIVSWNWRTDPNFGTEGAVIWTAEVENQASTPIESVRLELTTYDASGSVLASEFTYVSGLPPGGRKSTKSYATYYGTEDRARLQVARVR